MLIKREILPDLREHLFKKEITMIVGARQAGKTTLMKELMQEVVAQGARSLYLNLDSERDRAHVTTQADLIAKIRLEIGTSKGYVFIDEIQRKQDAGLFLKGIYDEDLPYKLIVTGSGSIELKEKIKESLAGRKQQFEVPTCTFEEFVHFKTAYRYEDNLHEFFATEKSLAEELMVEYMNFGGYPMVVLAERLNDKRAVIDEIYSSYIDRDITAFLRVDKKERYSNMMRLLASRIGTLMNYSEISKTLGIAQPTLKDYLWYGEKTFIIHKVTPFFRNAAKEISKSPVYYFNDFGMRNYVAGLFGNVKELGEHGLLFQNFVLRLIQEQLLHSGAKAHFWRTIDKAEVDFVLVHGSQPIPIEVKCRALKGPDITRSFSSFLEKYKPSAALVVNLSYEASRQVKDTMVHFVPAFKIGTAIRQLIEKNRIAL